MSTFFFSHFFSLYPFFPILLKCSVYSEVHLYVTWFGFVRNLIVKHTQSTGNCMTSMKEGILIINFILSLSSNLLYFPTLKVCPLIDTM